MSRLVVGDLPRVNAERDPDGVAYYWPGGVQTWSELDDRVNRLAHVLWEPLGLDAGDVVSILADNRPEHFELMFAASRAAVVHTALKTRSPVPEMLRQFDDAPASALVVGPGYEGPAAEISAARGVRLVDIEEYERLLADAPSTAIESHQDPEAVYSIMYTSGSTGEPKGVAVASRNEFAYAWTIAWSIDAKPHDVYQDVLPLVHRGGQYIGMCAALQGRPTVLGVPDPAAMLTDIARYRVTVPVLVPLIAQRMVEAVEADPDAHDVSSLRHFLVGSSPVSPELARRLLNAMPDAGISQIGGSSEGAATLCLSARDYREIAADPSVAHRAASVGRPTPGVRVRIVDENDQPLPDGEVGEIVYQGDMFIEGYWNKPELSAQTWRGGWFHSGDLGYRDADGYHYYTDRLFGRIKTGSETVFSREVETVLATHDEVLEAVVVGVPDPEWGEAVTAVVVSKAACDRDGLAERLRTHVRTELAPYKVPKRFLFVEALPRTALGKVPYGDVKRMARERLTEEGTG
jgi:acyl-CoA synthetase (AMP-forming)/AMP-acid ligase II